MINIEISDSIMPGLLDSLEAKFLSYSKFRNEIDGGNKFLHVTDLVYCRRKMLLQRQNPQLGAEISLKPAPFIGIVFEKGLRPILRDYFKDTNYDVVFSRKGKKVIDGVTIVGEADVVLIKKGHLDTEAVIEIKTRRGGNNYKDYYVLQLLLYQWLFDSKYAYLWSFSQSASPKEWKISQSSYIDDDFVRKLIHEPNQPMWEWECNYCQYRYGCEFAGYKGDETCKIPEMTE